MAEPVGRISAADLAAQLLGPDGSQVAVVDVRDDDHVGGHISSSLHAPSRVLAARLPALVRDLAGKRLVVFHCALSQQRGPAAAAAYLRERDREPSAGAQDAAVPQLVVVLDRGFVGWQEIYGEDSRLTVAYDRALWTEGYY